MLFALLVMCLHAVNDVSTFEHNKEKCYFGYTNVNIDRVQVEPSPNAKMFFRISVSKKEFQLRQPKVTSSFLLKDIQSKRGTKAFFSNFPKWKNAPFTFPNVLKLLF
jgi:hypothetical protein